MATKINNVIIEVERTKNIVLIFATPLNILAKEEEKK